MLKKISKIIFPLILGFCSLTSCQGEQKTSTYNTTFDPNGGSILVHSMDFNDGQNYSFPIPIFDGHSFISWLDENQNVIPNKGTYNFKKNLKLKASWGPLYYIKYDTRGGKPINPTPCYSSNAINYLPPASKEGCAFYSWYYNDKKVVLPFYNLKCEDITFVAHYIWKDEDSDFSYSLIHDETEVEISAYWGSDTSVIIPNTINGKKVTGIGDNAFSGNDLITGITLPNDLIDIGNNAFRDCSSLQRINYPEKLSTIGSYAFYNTDISEYIIGKNVKTVEKYSFAQTPFLEQITVDAANLNFVSENGALYTKNFSCLISCPSKVSGTFTINNNTEDVMEGAFYYADSINKIIIGDNLETIGSYAFSFSNVESFKVSENNKYLKVENGILYSFDYALLIAAPINISGVVEINKQTINICNAAFLNCECLTDVIISSKVNLISDDAFLFCKQLKLVSFKDKSNLFSLGKNCFNNCLALKTITLPNSLKRISSYAFAHSGVTEITYNSIMDEWSLIKKSNEWSFNSSIDVVHCTDGDIHVRKG